MLKVVEAIQARAQKALRAARPDAVVALMRAQARDRADAQPRNRAPPMPSIDALLMEAMAMAALRNVAQDEAARLEAAAIARGDWVRGSPA